MTNSFGESVLSVNSRGVGRIRVLNVYQGSALYPRLTFQLGVSLHDRPADEWAPGRPIENYEMRELRGELRLEEGRQAVGLLEWIGPRRHVRSGTAGPDHQIEVVCNLDWARLETIEEHRAGNESKLWLAFWPTLVGGEGFLDCEIQPIHALIPRDRWMEALGQLTGLRRTLVEVVLPTIQSSEFSATIGHIEEAHTQVDRGHSDEAVATCRRAIESMFAALNVRGEASALEERLAAVTDARRAKAYAAIISRLKEFGNITIHRPQARGRYMRAEAQFVVAVTSHVLALLANLLGRDANQRE